jgi:hypothetical protein
LFGEAAFDVALADDGKNVVVDEPAHGVANCSLLFAEKRVDVVEVLHGPDDSRGSQ